MSKRPKHSPKHRQAPARALSAEAPKKAIRTSLVLSSLAVAATGAAVTGGIAASPAGTSGDLSASAYTPQGDAPVLPSAEAAPEEASEAQADEAQQAEADEAEAAAAAKAKARAKAKAQAQAEAKADKRGQVVSRSDRRAKADPAKKAQLDQAQGRAVTGKRDLSDSDPRDIGRALLGEYGFSGDQFGCLDSLWTRESNWRVDADNPTSSAYGIPQSLPGSKMASEGPDWETNPVTQIRWGLGYIADRYGSPCGAWAHSESHGWY